MEAEVVSDARAKARKEAEELFRAVFPKPRTAQSTDPAELVQCSGLYANTSRQCSRLVHTAVGYCRHHRGQAPRKLEMPEDWLAGTPDRGPHS
jgi:hypothetical protein